MLAADAIADTGLEGFDVERFRTLYHAYRPEMIEHVYTWQTRGVRLYELLDDAERSQRAKREAELVEAAGSMQSRASAASGEATRCKGTEDIGPSGEPLALGALKLAIHLELSQLVVSAVQSMGCTLTVANAPKLLMIADELDCHPLRDRVSGYIVAHLMKVSEASTAFHVACALQLLLSPPLSLHPSSPPACYFLGHNLSRLGLHRTQAGADAPPCARRRHLRQPLRHHGQRRVHHGRARVPRLVARGAGSHGGLPRAG